MDRLQQAVARAEQKRHSGLAVTGKPALESSFMKSAKNKVELDFNHLEEERIVSEQLNSAYFPVFEVLRTEILAKMRDNGWRTLGIASPALGQGKTNIAINFAIAVAKEMTQQALLVDLDLNRPHLHKVLGFDVDTGIGDLFRGDAPIKDAMFDTGFERLLVLPGREPMDNASELLSGVEMTRLQSELLRDKSLLVIYSMPPLLRSDHALKAIEKCDCSLMVVEDGKNSSDELRKSLAIMNKTNFLGYVLNNADKAQMAITSFSS